MAAVVDLRVSIEKRSSYERVKHQMQAPNIQGRSQHLRDEKARLADELILLQSDVIARLQEELRQARAPTSQNREVKVIDSSSQAKGAQGWNTTVSGWVGVAACDIGGAAAGAYGLLQTVADQREVVEPILKDVQEALAGDSEEQAKLMNASAKKTLTYLAETNHAGFAPVRAAVVELAIVSEEELKEIKSSGEKAALVNPETVATLKHACIGILAVAEKKYPSRVKEINALKASLISADLVSQKEVDLVGPALKLIGLVSNIKGIEIPKVEEAPAQRYNVSWTDPKSKNKVSATWSGSLQDLLSTDHIAFNQNGGKSIKVPLRVITFENPKGTSIHTVPTVWEQGAPVFPSITDLSLDQFRSLKADQEVAYIGHHGQFRKALRAELVNETEWHKPKTIQVEVDGKKGTLTYNYLYQLSQEKVWVTFDKQNKAVQVESDKLIVTEKAIVNGKKVSYDLGEGPQEGTTDDNIEEEKIVVIASDGKLIHLEPVKHKVSLLKKPA